MVKNLNTKNIGMNFEASKIENKNNENIDRAERAEMLIDLLEEDFDFFNKKGLWKFLTMKNIGGIF